MSPQLMVQKQTDCAIPGTQIHDFDFLTLIWPHKICQQDGIQRKSKDFAGLNDLYSLRAELINALVWFKLNGCHIFPHLVANNLL